MSHSRLLLAGLGLAVAFMPACGGGGASAPTTPTATTAAAPPANTPAPPPVVNTVVTVSGTGLSPQVITIPVGARVTFTNTDNRPHDFSGGPDPATPECPEIDAAGFVVPGQSKQTGVFTTARTCRYHDHAYLGVAAFTGRIVIE